MSATLLREFISLLLSEEVMVLDEGVDDPLTLQGPFKKAISSSVIHRVCSIDAPELAKLLGETPEEYKQPSEHEIGISVDWDVGYGIPDVRGFEVETIDDVALLNQDDQITIHNMIGQLTEDEKDHLIQSKFEEQLDTQ